MKRLMIDMDNVITDGTFQAQIENFLGYPIDLAKVNYFLQNALGEKKDTFFQKGPLDMYQNAPLLEGAYETIKELNEKYELYIVSAYKIFDASYQEGNHLKAKMDYLQKKLPFIKTDQIIFMNKKDLIEFDIIIDDSLHNLTSGKMKLLFTAYHNKDISFEVLEKENIIRVNDWQEIAKILLED